MVYNNNNNNLCFSMQIELRDEIVHEFVFRKKRTFNQEIRKD